MKRYKDPGYLAKWEIDSSPRGIRSLLGSYATKTLCPLLDSNQPLLCCQSRVPLLHGGFKTFNTNDSQLVPHVSTELAQRCLVSEIGRDRTFSPWYDRTMRVNRASPPSHPDRCLAGLDHHRRGSITPARHSRGSITACKVFPGLDHPCKALPGLDHCMHGLPGTRSPLPGLDHCISGLDHPCKPTPGLDHPCKALPGLVHCMQGLPGEARGSITPTDGEKNKERYKYSNEGFQLRDVRLSTHRSH